MSTKFKRNLLFGFGASLFILLLSSAASFISIQNLLKNANLVNRTNEVIKNVNEFSSALVDAETGQRGYLLTRRDDFLEPFLKAEIRAHAAYTRLKELTADDSAQQRNIRRLSVAFRERLSTLKKNLEKHKATGEIVADSLLKGRVQMNEVRTLIDEVAKRENELLEARTAKMNTFAAFTPALVIVAAMIALLITVMFYARVRSDFDHRLKLQQELEVKDQQVSERIVIIQGIADKISSGKYEIRINDEQKDSLGSLAGSLNKMAESLQRSFGLLSDKEWLQSGIARLNEILLGEKDITDVGREVIEFISTYTNSNLGALYKWERNELRFLSGYAFRENDQHEGSLALITQAVTSRKPVEITDIPEDNIRISFLGGELKPVYAIALPITDGYLINGAMEFASTHKLSAREIEFLKSAAPAIGIAISVAENRKRLQELLEETQSQSEELKVQHSELENLNSELEVQAEKLQASEEELKVQQEELRHANQELEERSRLLEEKNQLISERNIEIQTKADQLAQSARYKSEFLANMSHELRTPLNSILLLSRLMSENAEQNLSPDQIEYAKVIQSSGNGLLSLIDEILDLSKIEAGKMQLDFQEFSLPDFVNEIKAMFTPISNEKNIRFETEIAAEVPFLIHTDRLRLEQILRNLISNAIKFTAKGYVKLLIRSDKKNLVQFRVIDTGIGIPTEKQQLVFEAFQQADGSTRRKYGGTGLGLSISRELAKLLGGDIQLKSVPDQGSEFMVTIPAFGHKTKPKVENGTEASEFAALHLRGHEKEQLSKRYISSVIPESIPDDRKEVEPDDRVILIVEDDVNFAKSLLDYTRKRGYKGIVSVRGDKGLELAKTYKPIGILLDIQLPIMSGWEVMDELKSDPETRHIPVHIMSSHEVKTESLVKGAVDFINKPVAFEQIGDVFRKIEYVLTHHPKKVLIVEENPKHAKALAYFLETFDVNPELNSDVNSAIKSLQNNDVNCVILDMGIPDQRAYDTLEEVKKTKGLENIPIIIFTGNSLSAAEEMKIKQYADSIVVKTAHSYKRILDEVSLFLHLMEKNDNGNSDRKYSKLGALQEVLENRTVLIADDDMRNIFSLTKALEKFKMKILPAVDGRDALNQLEQNDNVDIVLMDIMMPELDGYETIAAIRKNRKWKDLPIIAVTAKAMMGDRAKCISAGASDYITKPVDVDQLVSLLRVWLYEKGIKHSK